MRGGLVDVVVAVFDTQASVAMEADVIEAGGSVDVVRPNPSLRQPRLSTATLIRDAALRGATPEMISAVLDVPVSSVWAALGLHRRDAGAGAEVRQAPTHLEASGSGGYGVVERQIA